MRRISLVTQVFLLVLVSVAGAQSQEPRPEVVTIDSSDVFVRMETVTVRIWARATDAAGDVIAEGGGSGFLVGPNHVVTNSHVAFDRSYILAATPDPWEREAIQTSTLKFTYSVFLGPGDEVAATVEWRSAKDLALLKLSRPIERAPAVLAPGRFVSRGKTVYAMGFPGAADRGNTDPSYYVPSLTRGTLSRSLTDERGRKLYQTDAAINPGNSGGPLFNECGQVVGINVEKSLTPVRNAEGEIVRLPEGEGIGWAVQADDLIAGLTEAEVSYREASAVCTGIVAVTPPSVEVEPGPYWKDPYFWGVLFAILLGITAVAIALSKRGRERVKEVVTRARQSSSAAPTPSAYPVVNGKPVLNGLRGYFANSTIDLGTETLVIGRDARMSHLVYPTDSQDVSRRHCKVSYDSDKKVFRIEDCWSTNGVFDARGTRVPSGNTLTLHPGERFFLSGTQAFEVTLVTREADDVGQS